MNPWTTFLLKNLAAFLLGGLLTFAFAPYEIFPLAIVSLAGLIGLLITTSRPSSFLLGFCFGCGFFGLGVYWIYISIHSIGGVPIPLSLLITCGFIFILAIFPAAACHYTNRYTHSQRLQTLLAFPAIWLLSEWMRGWICTGFPWLFLGYSQTNSPLRGFAPIVGVNGISLIIVCCSSLVVASIYFYQQKRFYNLFKCVFLIIAFIAVGNTLSAIKWTTPIGKPLTVGLVQGAIPQMIKWSPEFLQLSFDRYEKLSEPLWGHYDLIIWPEAAIPLPLHSAESFITKMETKAEQTNTTLLLGIPIATEDNKSYYNAILSLSKAGRQTYSKRRLVPFGEYTPFDEYLSRFLTFLQIPMSDMRPGKLHQPAITYGDLKILSAICYEIAFPDLTRIADQPSNLILTLSNDAWFGKSHAQDQHFQMAVMRSLELAKPTIIVTNDGITGIISPQGKIEAIAPSRQVAVLTGEVQPMSGKTPWSNSGTGGCLLIAIILLVVTYRKRHLQI